MHSRGRQPLGSTEPLRTRRTPCCLVAMRRLQVRMRAAQLREQPLGGIALTIVFARAIGLAFGTGGWLAWPGERSLEIHGDYLEFGGEGEFIAHVAGEVVDGRLGEMEGGVEDAGLDDI